MHHTVCRCVCSAPALPCASVVLGLKADERTAIQRQWMCGEVPVIVATISFGMGVDKANVRYCTPSLLCS